jgi:class 3 adenylate cyclase
VDTRTGYAKTADGAHLGFAVSGNGPIDLLFIRPWMISFESLDEAPHASRYFRRLEAFARLVRYDVRGVGLSDPLDRSAPTSTAAMAEDALAVLDAAGIERAAVVGEQGGVAIAIELCHAHPDRVSALVCTNGYACLIADDDSPHGHPRAFVEQFLSSNADPDAQWEVDGSDDVDLLVPSLAGDATFREWFARASRRGASPATARAVLDVTARADVRPMLPALRVPTLVLHAEHSRFIPVQVGQYLAEHIDGARFVGLDSADTAPWGESGDVIADEVEEFLTGRRSGSVERVLATVLFTDIVDSTGRAAALGDRAWRALLDEHDAIVRSELARFGGREVNTTGDGFIAAFESPTQAVRAGAAMAAAAQTIAIRVGVHTGECERRGNDLAGLTVHIAARVAALAAPGEVLVSRTVRDLVAGSGLQFAPRGEHELKGVPDVWQLFALVESPDHG